MRWRVLLLGFAPLLAGGCSMSEQDRTRLLESSQRTNYEVAEDSVVRELRAPSDTGRLIYDPAMNLSVRTAPAAGAQEVWAPFGIARPDTLQRVIRP